MAFDSGEGVVVLGEGGGERDYLRGWVSGGHPLRGGTFCV